MLAINLTGVFLCLKHEIMQMLAQGGGGAIVNTASIAGLIGLATSGHYVAAKHGVVGLTKTAAIEYAKDGIRVNCVNPGYITTPMTEEIVRTRIDEVMAKVPMNRMGVPEEIAEAVVWMCSDKASFMTGASQVVDGGYFGVSRTTYIDAAHVILRREPCGALAQLGDDRMGRSALVRHDPRAAQQRLPFCHFGGDEGIRCFGRAVLCDRDAEFVEPLCQSRVGQRTVGHRVHCGNNVRRRAGGREDGVPGVGLVAGQRFGDRRQIRQRRQSFFRGHRKRAQCAAFDMREGRRGAVDHRSIWPPIRSVTAGPLPR